MLIYRFLENKYTQYFPYGIMKVHSYKLLKTNTVDRGDGKMEPTTYYSRPGEITTLNKYRKFTSWLTDDPDSICQVVQGLLVHDMWFEHYGLEYIKENGYPQKIAYMEDLLDKAYEIDPGNLAYPRHPAKRVVACCREFATLMCAILRAKGIPARSRCGFATYFGWDGNYEDHWICEYYNGTRWVMCDPQIDPLQLSYITNWGLEQLDNIDKMSQIKFFNPRDLKEGEFISAGEAWIMCREHGADPSKFGIGADIDPALGIYSLHGLWFIRGQLLRDIAALNKVETVPYLIRICQGLDWKSWHLVYARDEELTPRELRFLDKMARLTLDVNANFDQIREQYEKRQELQVPQAILER